MRTQSDKSRFLTTAAGMLFMIYALQASEPKIEIKDDAVQGKPVVNSVTLEAGRGKILLQRKGWASVRVSSPSGQAVEITDPFLYCVQVEGPERGGYWNDPVNWDLAKFTPLTDKGSAAGQSGRNGLLINLTQPTWGLTKQVSLMADNEIPCVYVHCRLTADRMVKLGIDRQLIYITNPVERQFIVDGKNVEPDKDVRINEYAVIRWMKPDVSVALIQTPLPQQKAAGVRIQPGLLRFHQKDGKFTGAELSLDKTAGTMEPGESLWQEYILLWGDGDISALVGKVLGELRAGRLDRSFYRPSDAGGR
jgi:hypothetical protein